MTTTREEWRVVQRDDRYGGREVPIGVRDEREARGRQQFLRGLGSSAKVVRIERREVTEWKRTHLEWDLSQP